MDGQGQRSRAPAQTEPAILQRLFGVTPAEAARPCGTVKATFRAQLRAAYAKLGINGRDELATF